MNHDVGRLKESVLRHLRKHASDGQSIRQRKQRNILHAKDAELYNQAVVELARDGVVEVFDEGPHHAKYIRLAVAEFPDMH